MRRFLTLGIKGDGKVKILHGAENDKRTHVDKFNDLAGKKSKKKSEFAEIQVVELSSVVKRKRFGNVEGSGKRTVARTVKHKKGAKKAAKKKGEQKKAPRTDKRTVARTVKPHGKAAKSAARSAKKTSKASKKKAPRKSAKVSAKAPAPTGKTDEGLFPSAKPVEG